MSEIVLNVVDPTRAIHGRTHGSHLDSVVAALAAEPETIEELEAAVTRFHKWPHEAGFFQNFDRGICEEPWDAGVAIVDLTARLIACESTYSSPSHEGTVDYHDGHHATAIHVNYRIPEDWRLLDWIECWDSLARDRRAERAARQQLDARPVLYNDVIQFIARECRAAHAAGAADPIADLHARWLLTPHEGLRGSTPLTTSGQSPREVLLAKHNLLEMDLQWREQQWAFVGECPPGLSPDSAAYRFGGFGTHEIVLYHELVRHLLHECWERLVSGKATTAAEEVARLVRARDRWLVADRRYAHGMTPYYMIERERARLPLALSAHESVVSEGSSGDDDCPLCRMMAADFSPCFWHLDGCNLDDDFAFSFHRTREEWEAERRRREEFDREFTARHMARLAAGDEAGVLRSPWQSSYFDEDALDGAPRAEATCLLQLALAGYLTELTGDLDADPQGAVLARALRRQFANLREVLGEEGGAALLAPSLDRLTASLTAVADVVPDLCAKAKDLERLVERLRELHG